VSRLALPIPARSDLDTRRLTHSRALASVEKAGPSRYYHSRLHSYPAAGSTRRNVANETTVGTQRFQTKMNQTMATKLTTRKEGERRSTLLAPGSRSSARNSAAFLALALALVPAPLVVAVAVEREAHPVVGDWDKVDMGAEPAEWPHSLVPLECHPQSPRPDHDRATRVHGHAEGPEEACVEGTRWE